jgi:16S rRNA (guanine527-N7)-methyltransferase
MATFRPLPPLSAAPLFAPESIGADLIALGASQAALPKLGAYLGHLLAMNEAMNLTAITDPGQAWTKHIYDSLTVLPLLPNGQGLRLIDIGSGGGLPGIPLAIARPDMQVTLVESTRKKADFLRAVAAAVGASNVCVEASRAEDLQKAPHLAAYDVVTARAVARLMQLIAWTAPFAKHGGRLLLIKGQRADEELAEASPLTQKLGLEHEKTVTTQTGRIVVLGKRKSPPGDQSREVP